MAPGGYTPGMSTLLMILSQAPPPPPAPPQTAPWLNLDRIFWLTILSIFLLTLLSAFIRRISKDKALKLFHGSHATFLSEKRPTLWGDVLVQSQGLEMLFDQAYTNRRGLVKASALIYEDEYPPMVALTRTVHGLSEKERAIREAQIRRTFKPGFFRRTRRKLANMLNTMRDAITKTVSLVIGRVTRTDPTGAVVASQAPDITNLSGTVVSLASNAYEPLLERHIGRRVLLELLNPPGVNPPIVELPGYLVDYTPKFIAVFNVDHTPVETFSITLTPNVPPDPQHPNTRIMYANGAPTLVADGPDVIVLLAMEIDGRRLDMGIALTPGMAVELPRHEQPLVLHMERTRQVDLVCPRARARIRFGAETRQTRRGEWLGVAPLVESLTRRITGAEDGNGSSRPR